TFYRNGFEIGLPLVECPGVSALAGDGDVLRVDLGTGEVANETRGTALRARPASPFLLEMLEAGGLSPLAARLAGELDGEPQAAGTRPGNRTLVPMCRCRGPTS